jgi:tetratricopeptide (TPR) repeat protein
MVCARCGHISADGALRCDRCGAAFAQAGVITGEEVPIDTTGLPPGATFGAATDGTTASATGQETTGGGTETRDPLAADTTVAGNSSATRPHGGPLRVGQAFGPRYHIIKLLGAGGMGAVYQAWDAELSVAVALKVIRTDSRRRVVSAEAEKQFKHELLLARQVTHKNVVRIHDLGEIDGIKYITMPHVQGRNLGSILRTEGKLPIAKALRIARQIADGLLAAHEAGVVHRDLKPANIMISTTGDDPHALIMDFGISASTEEARGGEIVGTLEYMAPEQSTGGAVDSRADIYAFGMILRELLVGPRAVTATTAQERVAAMRQRTTRGMPSVRSVDETISVPVDALVTRCLERNPAARFQSSADLVAALAALDDAGELIPEPKRLTKRMMAATAVIVAALLGGTYFATRKLVTPPKAHEPVSVVIADVQNTSGDPAFDRTLEPVLKLALEQAGFISAYDRNGIARSLGVRPPETLDERAALELAVKQGVGIVLSGSVDRQGNGYGVTFKATQAVTGNVIANARNRASGKDQVVSVATRLAAAVRQALGDDTPDSDKRFAMETLSATSLEVVRDYASAAQAMSNSRFEEAQRHFARAAERDPNFGLAYAGLAITSYNLDRQQDAEKWAKEAVSHLDGMTERERYRTRGLFYMITGDDQQCVKEFGDLVARYAADVGARNNLALCLSRLRDMPKAVDQMQQVVSILPNRPLYRQNLALYSAYNGDFQTAEAAVRELNDPGWLGLIALAFSQILQGQVGQAAETYTNLGKINELGASYSASGLGDLALYEGRLSDAVRIFTQGAAADLAGNDPDRAANKFAAIAYTQLLRQQKSAAIAAADKALANSSAAKIRFLAARVFVEAGANEKVRPLVASLGSELQAAPQAYAKIVDAEAALKGGDARQAIKLLTEANAVLDTWIGHFDLGKAYLAAGGFTQADSEFDRSIKRRGETLALFLDEEPTYGYFPPVYYYQGRVREGLNNARFAESYRAYLDIRAKSTEDPLLPEVRRRAGG